MYLLLIIKGELADIENRVESYTKRPVQSFRFKVSLHASQNQNILDMNFLSHHNPCHSVSFGQCNITDKDKKQ